MKIPIHTVSTAVNKTTKIAQKILFGSAVFSELQCSK